MSKQPKRSAQISEHDIRTWTEYVATGTVENEKHAKELVRLGKRSINLADATAIVDFMTRRNDGYISAIIERNAIIEKVLAKVGATENMFKEAQAEYEKELEQVQELIKGAKEAVKDPE